MGIHLSCHILNLFAGARISLMAKIIPAALSWTDRSVLTCGELPPTPREESRQTNVILQYKLLPSILSAVCSVIQQS